MFSFVRSRLLNLTHMGSRQISYLNQDQAAALDVELMSPKYGFSIDQLMELAGLSCASAIADFIGRRQLSLLGNRKILVVCGPGNNGGDGLVAARHLHHFGFEPKLYYPKRTDKDLYQRLVQQLRTLNIEEVHELNEDYVKGCALVVDAVFGFSFKGSVRAPFDSILPVLAKSGVPIASVDIPSGYSVDGGNESGIDLQPSMLISLTAPKLCAKEFKGAHYLGGRFVPVGIASDYNLVLPQYPGSQQHILLEDLS